MQFDVLSALARLDVDPWLEAATLARLPKAIATEKLGSLMAQLPGAATACSDPGTITARLIAQLPSRAGSKIASATMALEADAAVGTRAVIRVVFST